MTLPTTTGQHLQLPPNCPLPRARQLLRAEGWRLTTDPRGRLLAAPLH